MNAFTRGNIAAAERDVRRCIALLEEARCGVELSLLPHTIAKALSDAQSAAGTLERAIRLEDEVEDFERRRVDQ